MTDDLRYVKGLTRFTYWDNPDINPLLMPDTDRSTIDLFAHEVLSEECHTLYAAGDPEVIFEYVKKDVWAFHFSWVVDQIVQWRLENTPESRANFYRLMTMYMDERGHDPLPEIARLILRDQAIFKKIVELNQRQKIPLRSSKHREGCFTVVAEEQGLSKESIEEIYKTYKSKADELMGKKDPRLLSPHLFQKGQNKVLQDAFTTLGWDKSVHTPSEPVFSSWDEIFQWLDEMAAHLSPTGG